MATTSNSGFNFNNNQTPIKNRDISSSTFHPTVCLEDWWLIKVEKEKEVEGKRLAIGGLALREHLSSRIFSSAPIIKRYDLFTLKTADGITIIIKGQINTSRTLENGFPSEVCRHFVLGFPYFWETFADLCNEIEPTGISFPTSMSGFDESMMRPSLPDCLGGKAAVTRTLNHIISSHAASVLTKEINADLLGKCNGRDLEKPTVPISTDMKSCSPGMGDSLPEETLSDEKSKSERNHGNDKGLLHEIEEETVNNEDNLLSNKQDNFNSDGFNNDPESEVLKGNCFKEKLENSIDDILVPQMNTEVVKSSDIEPIATTGTLIVKEGGRTDEETMENEDNITPHIQDFLHIDGSNELEGEVLEKSTFKENVENSTDDIPVLHLNAEVAKSSDIEPLVTKEALADREDDRINDEIVENKGNSLSDNQDNLNHDGCNEPESEVLIENSFKEKLGSSTDDIPLPHLNAEVVKPSDVDPLATEEILTDKEDAGIMTLSNTSKRTTRSSVKYLRNYDTASEVVKPSDVDPLATGEILTDKEDAGIATLSNTSKRTTRSSVKNLRNYDTPSDEHSVPTDFDLKLFPSMVGKSVRAKKSSTRLSEGSKKSGTNGEDKVRIVGGLKSKRTKICSSAPQDYEVNMISVIELTGSAGGNNSFDSIVEKHASASTSPDVGVPKFSSKIKKCNNITKKHASRNRSTSIASDVKYDNSSKVSVVLPVDLKSSSEKLDSSKCSRNDSNKTKRSLRSERSANLSCHHDTGNDESSKSMGSDVKNVCLNEGNVDVPVDISGSYTTTLSNQTNSKRGVKERKRSRPKKKQTGSSSISGSQGCVVIPGLCVEQKLTHGSSVGDERILGESLETPYVGSPEVSDRAGNCSPCTMEDSTAQRNLESNVNCSTELGMDTINVTPNKGTSTKIITSYRFKNIEGGGGKNIASNSWVEDENNVLAASSAATKEPGRKHLIGSCASNPSSHKIDNVKEIGSLSQGRRTSSRLKSLANKCKEDKPTSRRLEFEGNKLNSVLRGSDFVKSDVDKVDCEPEGRSALDQPKMGLQEILPEQTELENQSSKAGTQMNRMLSSVPSGAVENVNCKSANDDSENNEPRKSCISSITLGNMKHASDLEISKKIKDRQGGSCGRQTKRKVVLPSPVTRNKKKSLGLLSPEDLSLKRSRSGRLLVPPVDFWRNQQVVYEMGGQIAGVQDGLPFLESSTGSKSESVKARRKLI